MDSPNDPGKPATPPEKLPRRTAFWRRPFPPHADPVTFGGERRVPGSAYSSNSSNPLRSLIADWWGDIRYEQERRIIVTLAVALLLSAVLVAILAISTSLRMREERAVPSLSKAAGSLQPPRETAVVPVNGVLEQAAGLVVEGNLEEASKILHSAEISLLRLQGIIAWKSGDTPTAAGRFERALALDPSSSPDLVNLAGIRLLEKNPAAAVELLKKAQESAPDEVYIANRYLLARIEAGDLGGVRSDVQTALSVSPQNSLDRIAFAAAALELAAGQFSNAANFLYAAQGKLPAGTFNSLLNEAPISAYADKQEIRPFFANRNAPAPNADALRVSPSR